VGLRRRDYAGFWAWFADASASVHGPQDVDRAFLDALERRLTGVDRRLDFEVGVRPASDEMELVVSAGGLDKVAPIVEALVAAAPDLPGWRVTAFRPPRPVDGSAVRVREAVVAADDVWVETSGGGDAVVLTAHVRDLERDLADRMRAAHLLVEQALGERVLVERVVAIDWRHLDGPPPAAARRLADLPDALPE
jgi:hypothetical protein